MRQISASKRSQNVVEIAKTDYCGFGQVLPVILPHPSISRYRKTLLTITNKNPADHHDQQGARSISFIGQFINCIRFLSDYCKDVATI